MERIFISSLARGDMADIRAQARAAVESLDMAPVMFETTGASPEGSRRLLLDRLAVCDAMILLLGAEYGEPGERGVSPTEEEFRHAIEHNVPVLALVQDDEREPEQDDFVQRVRGGWEKGSFAPQFTGHADVALAVVRALNAWRTAGPQSELDASARTRAAELAGEDRRHRNQMGSGVKLRAAFVPALARPLLDATTVQQADLPRHLQDTARWSGLVSHDMTLSISNEADGFRMHAKGQQWEDVDLFVGLRGEIVAEGAVSGSDRFSGGMLVVGERVIEVLQRAVAFAVGVWRHIDGRDEVRGVYVSLAVPDAGSKSWADSEQSATRTSFGGFGSPAVITAPPDPLGLRAADLGRPETIARLQAELRRAFELGGTH